MIECQYFIGDSSGYYDFIIGHTTTKQPGITERHHIVPKSLGGNDEPINIVHLRIEDHLTAHKMLCEMTAGLYRAKMVFAYYKMINGRQGLLVSVSDEERRRMHQLFGEANRLNNTGRIKSPETRRKLSIANTGKQISASTRQKQSSAMKGKYLGRSFEDRYGKERAEAITEKIRQGHIGRSHPWAQVANRNPNKIAKTAAAHRGMKRTVESRAKMSAAAKARPAPNTGKRYVHHNDTGDVLMIDRCLPTPNNYSDGYGFRVVHRFNNHTIERRTLKKGEPTPAGFMDGRSPRKSNGKT